VFYLTLILMAEHRFICRSEPGQTILSSGLEVGGQMRGAATQAMR